MKYGFLLKRHDRTETGDSSMFYRTVNEFDQFQIRVKELVVDVNYGFTTQRE